MTIALSQFSPPSKGAMLSIGGGVLSGATLTSPTIDLNSQQLIYFYGSVKIGASADLRLFINSDTTAGNYDTSINAAASANNATIFASASSGNVFRFEGWLFNDINSQPTFLLKISKLSTTSMVSSEIAILWRTASTNVTSFQFNQSTGSLTSGSMSVFSISTVGNANGWGEGTAFPASPSLNQKFYRTDVNLLCYYDGTRWLTCQEYSIAGAGGMDSLTPVSATNAIARIAIRSDYSLYYTRLSIVTFISGGTSNGSNKWVIAFTEANAANANLTTIATVDTSTGPDTVSNWVQHDVAINSAMSATAKIIQAIATKTGAPGGLYYDTQLYARLIVT